MRTIIVNATALDASGALMILRQFVANIPLDEREWIIFVSPLVELHTDNPSVRFVPIEGVKPLIKRFLWDAFGVKKWLKNNNITPSTSISLQNTNFRTGYKIPNYIYYHQPIPFYAHHWSIFKSEERPLWFYKHIYPFFVGIFLNKRTKIFVQLEYIKKGFVKRFNFEGDKIYVVRPSVILPSIHSKKLPLDLNTEKINLFYPATPYFYKNHKIIIDALNSKKNANFVVYFTCNKEDIGCDISENIHFLGTVSFESVMSMYSSCDAVVFPSYIETFGLPLIEAASTGCSIIAADLPYSHEVLKGYDGARFAPFDDAKKWADAIANVKKGMRSKPMKINTEPSWDKLFEIIT